MPGWIFPSATNRKSWIVPFLLIVFASCNPIPTTGTTAQPPAAGTEPAPVFVPAMCTLMGRDVRSDVPAGHPVILMWGWSAESQEQIEDYIRAAVVTVTFDGIEVQGMQQGGLPFDDSAGVFRAVWTAEIGIPAPGIHPIAYLLTFREKIFDGVAYYGPGTKNERQEDRCEVEVK